MELQIQDLVTSIRKEGIDAANSEAESILAEAKKKAEAIIRDLIMIDEQMPQTQKKNLLRQREDILYRYHEAPDLRELDHNAYRLINAVSDFATHADPVRRRSNYQESLFAKVVDGHSMIDRAYEMVKAV